MASALKEEEIPNFYQLLGVPKTASNEEIQSAFRKAALKVHPDKNPGQSSLATELFKKLNDAKITLLDKDQRDQHDQKLAEEGVRDPNALPLQCHTCLNKNHSGKANCLHGHGHKSPFWDEFKRFEQEFSRLDNAGDYASRFRVGMEKGLEQFRNIRLKDIFPFVNLTDLETSENHFQDYRELLKEEILSKLEAFSPTSTKGLERLALQIADLFERFGGSGETFFQDFALKDQEAFNILKSTLEQNPTLKSWRVKLDPKPDGKLELYDLTILGMNQLKLLYAFLGIEIGEKPNLNSLLHKLANIIPVATKEQILEIFQTKRGVNPFHPSLPNPSNLTKSCSSCGNVSRWLKKHFWASCFICNGYFCTECSPRLVQSKLPFQGIEMRTVCVNCIDCFREIQAKQWFSNALIQFQSNLISLQVLKACCKMAKFCWHNEQLCAKIDETLARLMVQEESFHQFMSYQFCKTCRSGKETDILYLLIQGFINTVTEETDIQIPLQAQYLEDAIEWIDYQQDPSISKQLSEVRLKAISKKLDLMQENDNNLKANIDMISHHIQGSISSYSVEKIIEIISFLEEDDESLVLKGSLKRVLNDPLITNLQGHPMVRLCQGILTILENSSKGMEILAKCYFEGYTQIPGDFPQLMAQVATLKCVRKARVEFYKQLQNVSFQSLLDNTEKTKENLNQIGKSTMKWENLSVTGADIKMFQKLEEAVSKLIDSGKWNSLKAAFAYLDFIGACCSPSQLIVTILIASQWLAKSMMVSSQLSHKFACKMMIMSWTTCVASLSFEFGLHPYMQFLVSEIIFSLQFFACTQVPYGKSPELEANSLCQHLEWLACSSRLCPFQAIPVWVSSAEAILFKIISNSVCNEYLFQVLEQDPEDRQLTEAILRYQLFETNFSGHCKIEESTESELRLNAMHALLSEKNWSWDSVQKLTHSNVQTIDNQGWFVRNQKLSGQVLADGIHGIKGFSINKQSNSIELILDQSTISSMMFWKSERSQPLLCWQDIAIGITMDKPFSFFSLEGINQRETIHHPFNEVIFKPDEIEGSEFLSTLFQTDYLLKQFSMGQEISTVPPFNHRPSSDGLLKGLPADLQDILKPIHQRGSSSSRVHRFWIEADDLDYDIQEDEKQLTFLFGKVTMKVRNMPMIFNEMGELKDKETRDPDSPEEKFASDFSENYYKIGQAFPEFLRLKELCKVQQMGHFITSYRTILEDSLNKVRDLNSQEMKNKIKESERSALLSLTSQFENNLNRIRGEVKKQVGNNINDDHIGQVKSSMSSSAGCSFSWNEIKDWLKYGQTSAMVDRFTNVKASEIHAQVVKAFKDLVTEKEKELEAFNNGINALKKNTTNKISDGCRWVPAICHKEEQRIHYGGVVLCPKLNNTRLSSSTWMVTRKPLVVDKVVAAKPKEFTPRPFKPPSTTTSRQDSSRKDPPKTTASSAGNSSGTSSRGGNSGSNNSGSSSGGSNNSGSSSGGSNNGGSNNGGSNNGRGNKPPKPVELLTKKGEGNIKKYEGNSEKKRLLEVSNQFDGKVFDKAKGLDSKTLVGGSKVRDRNKEFRIDYQPPIKRGDKFFVNIQIQKNGVTAKENGGSSTYAQVIYPFDAKISAEQIREAIAKSIEEGVIVEIVEK